MMDAEIIAVGSELLTPFRLDTNSLYLTGKLNALGIEVRFKTIVGDDRQRLAEVFSTALKRSRWIVVTGGLGPTEDDLCREVVAEVLERPLQEDPRIRRKIEARFARAQERLSPGDVRDTQRIPPGGTPGWATFALRGGVRVAERLTVDVGLENLGNRDYRHHGSGVNEPGAQAVLSVGWGF